MKRIIGTFERLRIGEQPTVVRARAGAVMELRVPGVGLRLTSA